MFAVLNLQNGQRSGLFEWMGRLLFTQYPDIRLVRYGESKIHIISYKGGEKQIDWDFLKEVTGRLGYNLVMPDIKCPHPNIRRFQPYQFLRRTTRNGVAKIIEDIELPLYKKSIVLVDEYGRYLDYTHTLIKYCAVVKVYTQNVQKYERFANDIMNLYGAPVIVSDEPDILSSHSVIVAPDGIREELCSRIRNTVLSVHELPASANVRQVYDFECETDEEIEALRLKGISNSDILGALYELNCIRGLGELVPQYCRFNGEQVALSEVSKYITGELKDEILI